MAYKGWLQPGSVADRLNKEHPGMIFEIGDNPQLVIDKEEILKDAKNAYAQVETGMPKITAHGIVDQCEAIKQLLLAKNEKYGDSAKHPLNIFSTSSPLDQIGARLDDKLKRVKNMGGLLQVLTDAKHAEEDTVLDIIGYLILARVVQNQLS